VIVSNVGGPAERVRHEIDGLHFEVGDPQSLAETMRRACTENGLWKRLAAGITPPPGREVMVGEYAALYRGEQAPARLTAAASAG
jgi:glycosyltransferase involved in cell wall biosynthesis